MAQAQVCKRSALAIAALVSLACALLYTRSIIMPLTVITRAAEDMSRGRFQARAAVTGVTEATRSPEVRM